MRVLFYSSLKSVDDFKTQGFYVEDINILEELGYNVTCTNKIIPFLTSSYDVAFLYFYKKSLFPALFARIRNKKVFHTGGIDDLSRRIEMSPFRRFLIKIFFLCNYLLSSRINIVSDSDYANVLSFLNRLNIKKINKISVFPHSVLFLPRANSQIKVAHTFITVCWMSTVGNVKRKGVDKAIEFFLMYSREYKDSKLYIVGKKGQGSRYLMNLPAYKEVSNQIKFTGFISEEEKVKLFNSAMFYIQLSNYEGFGIAALEANLSKCYVIHSGSGGYLKTSDIWGEKILDKGKIITSKVNSFISEFDYNSEITRFEKRLNYLVLKYSRLNRLKNFFNFLNG